MSLVYFNSFQDQSFFELLKKYRFQLDDPKLTLTELHQMTDHLAVILQNENGSERAFEEMTTFISEIEDKENQRRSDDQSLLTFIQQLGFEVKQLKLQVDTLAPSAIEMKLDELVAWHQVLSEKKAFQSEFFQKELNTLQSMLEDLIFRFHFPIVGILEKSDNEKIMRYLKETQEYLFKRKEAPFLTQDDLTCFLEKKLHRTVKNLKEVKDRYFVTQIVLDYLHATIG